MRYLITLLVVVPVASAQSPTYWQDVRPALRKHCIACHSARNLKEVDVSGGLAMDSYTAFMKDARKPVVKPGKSAESEIIKRVTSADDNVRMPPGDDRVPEETVALLKRWIDSGAAEGTRPEETAPVVRTPGATRRKLPVTLTTTTT